MSDIAPLSADRLDLVQVGEYFEYLFRAERSGEKFPVDLDLVWPLAYERKDNAKKALVECVEYYEGEDWVFRQNAEKSKPPQKGRPQDKIHLSVACFEFFIARKVRPVFEVYRQCRVLVSGEAERAAAKPSLPYHLNRYLANEDQIPAGYFSVLQEVTLGLVAPLERRGYNLPEKVVPDISVGRCFCRFLREEKGIDPGTFPEYRHRYEDGRVVPARLYPLALLPDFRDYFQRCWLPEQSPRYFKERDPIALAVVAKILKAPENEHSTT